MSYANQNEAWQPGEKVIARYNFSGSSPDDLPFRKWESLTVVTPTRDPNWYKARNADNRCGMIPANYVTRRSAVKLNAMPWFHGKISREEAERLLTPREDGLFLVRESTNYPGDYTLCVCSAGRVEHYRVISADKRLTIDEEVFFDCLNRLVEHYECDADGLCSQLHRSVPKLGGQNFSVDPGAFEAAGWMIPREDIELGERIGRGEFGEVLLARYRGECVAVKTLRDCDSAVQQQLLAEASVMTALRHTNLVQLIGVVFETDVIHQVLEYMSQGSLVEYLRTRGRLVITKSDLIGFACDTCSGMAYLESMHVVHRDLAARNVLISSSGTAKVSDFGLARDECFQREAGKIPIKWTAPEAIKDNAFSSKSDMWSFGVLLWEIYSFGRGPYPRIAINDVVRHVNGGYRMESPDGCPPEIYHLMREAWHVDPDNRPSFRQAVDRLNTFRSNMTS